MGYMENKREYFNEVTDYKKKHYIYENLCSYDFYVIMNGIMEMQKKVNINFNAKKLITEKCKREKSNKNTFKGFLIVQFIIGVMAIIGASYLNMILSLLQMLLPYIFFEVFCCFLSKPLSGKIKFMHNRELEKILQTVCQGLNLNWFSVKEDYQKAESSSYMGWGWGGLAAAGVLSIISSSKASNLNARMERAVLYIAYNKMVDYFNATYYPDEYEKYIESLPKNL
jgi:hypothetical protein